MNCPLCVGQQTLAFQHQDWGTTKHYLCETCDLIFLDPSAHLSAVAERDRYDLHENRDDSPGYIQYLKPTLDRICALYPDSEKRRSTHVLDYGSGPNPVLAKLLSEQGFRVQHFDPYFAPNKSVFGEKFDLIVSTEVFEHFYNPKMEIARLREMLAPQRGTLMIRTGLHEGMESFKKWWYARDPSHVVFYSAKTANWIQKTWQFPHLEVNDLRF